MLFARPYTFLYFARQIDVNNCKLKIVSSAHRKHPHFSFNPTNSNKYVIVGKSLMCCAIFLQCFALFYMIHRRIAGLVVHRFSCCTAVSSMVRVDCCHAVVGRRMRKMRAVTSSHSEHAPFVLGNGTCLFCLPARLLCAVAKLYFQIKKPVGDQDSSFLLPFNNHPCLLFRESSLYIFFLNAPSKQGECL